MTNINVEQMKYDEETETAYIYFTEPEKFEFYTELLPENSEIMLDLGKDVPIVGIELDGELAKKIAQLPSEQRCFVKRTDNYGKDFYTFRLNDQPIKHAISYERIVDVKFLFADDEFLDFLGIEVYSDNPHYIFVQSQNDEQSKGLFKKILGKLKS
jgi:uncharacterized protein YuzE